MLRCRRLKDDLASYTEVVIFIPQASKISLQRKKKLLDSGESLNTEERQEKGDLNWLRKLRKVSQTTKNYFNKASGDFTSTQKLLSFKRNGKRLLQVEVHPNEIKRRSFSGLSPSPFRYTDNSELTMKKLGPGDLAAIGDCLPSAIYSSGMSQCVSPKETEKMDEFENGSYSRDQAVLVPIMKSSEENPPLSLVAAFCKSGLTPPLPIYYAPILPPIVPDESDGAKNRIHDNYISAKKQILGDSNSVPRIQIRAETRCSAKSSSQSFLSCYSDKHSNNSETPVSLSEASLSSLSEASLSSVASDYNQHRKSSNESILQKRGAGSKVNAVKRKLDFANFNQVSEATSVNV